jgi:hypothetical protein
MKGIVLALALAGAVVGTQRLKPEGKFELTVFMEIEAQVSIGTVHRAETTASEMFAASGVKLKWRGDKPNCARHPELCNGPSGLPLRVKLAAEWAQGLIDEEMAMAQPGLGTITVWYGRIEPMSRTWPGLIPVLLAHVLVHEIAHVLQGMPRHSESGVMKAHWSIADYQDMMKKPLPFTDIDIRMIRTGLGLRRSTSVPLR